MLELIIVLIFFIVIFYYFRFIRRLFNDNKKIIRVDKIPLSRKEENGSDILEQFIHRKPRCLEAYDIEDSPSEIRNNWKQGPEFLSKIVKCECGNPEFYVYASYNNDMLLAPIFLECSKCLSKNLIFNPSIHGWDGENGDDASLVGDKDPKKVNKIPRRVIVDYSYQGAENYAELIKEGIKNPQDYFDVMIISTVNEKGRLDEIVAYECA